MVYDVIMIKLRLLRTYNSLRADNSPKTTILIYRRWHHAKEIILFRTFFPSNKKQHYSEGIFCILDANANVHYLKDYVHGLY